jgi:hypothetical protein
MKKFGVLLILIIFISIACGSSTDTGVDTSDTTADALGTTVDPFPVYLPSLNGSGVAETIWIPNGRPIYALLVSGFHQNRNLNMFHFYNFAKCLLERGAYVHYAWWNNLLAPYMERPLHNENSVPSTGPLPVADMLNILPFPALLNKAIPNDDIQFQADAKALLTAIRAKNPDAAIILVGHSMGGDSVARLADSVDGDIDIALLAPIDPVGNRSCVRYYSPDSPWVGLPFCNGLFNFTRWRATHLEWLTTKITIFPWEFDPPRRAFTDKIKYLYHRWQQEFAPPFDFACPPGSRYWDCGSGRPYEEYLFDYHPDTHVYTIQQALEQGSTNVQSEVLTDLLSHYDAPRYDGDDLTGELDGHGEIVGFRGVKPGTSDSYPLALDAPEYWPSLAIERSFDEEDDRANVRNLRVSLLKDWEADPDYLDTNDWAPTNPDLCMVSGDLCEILRTAVNAVPVADAGPDQTVECSGPSGAEVTLDGSGSTDPNDDPLTFTWTGPFGTLTGQMVYPNLPLGTHTITLTVDDGRGQTDSDVVDINVMDSTPPLMSVSLTPDVLWPPNHKMMSIAASIQVSDTCDDSPMVELESIICNEPDNGLGDGNTNDDIQGASYGTDDRAFSLRAERAGLGDGRIYLITYTVADDTGNSNKASDTVTVPHN